MCVQYDRINFDENDNNEKKNRKHLKQNSGDFLNITFHFPS